MRHLTAQTLLLFCLWQVSAANLPRHGGHEHYPTTVESTPAGPETAAADSDHGAHGDHSGHGHDHGDGVEQGTGHGHSMGHDGFNFTPSGIAWPQCLRDCCNQFFEFFPEPVNNPLCVNEDFYKNTTDCIVESCTPYEQGSYAVVAEIECPQGQGFAVGIDKAAVVEDLMERGGSPQDCEGVNNETVICTNATAEEPEVVGAASRNVMLGGGLSVGMMMVFLAGYPLLYFL